MSDTYLWIYFKIHRSIFFLVSPKDANDLHFITFKGGQKSPSVPCADVFSTGTDSTTSAQHDPAVAAVTSRSTKVDNGKMGPNSVVNLLKHSRNPLYCKATAASLIAAWRHEL